MFVTKKVRKRTIKAVLVILLFCVSKSDAADDNLQVSNSTKNRLNNTVATSDAHGVKAEDHDALTNVENKNYNTKLDKSEQKSSLNVDSKIQNCKSEDGEHQPSALDSQQQDETVGGSEQSSEAQDEKSDNSKIEEINNEGASDQKKQTSKTEDSNRKTNLNDVDSPLVEEDNTQVKKRETFSGEFIGIPRDSSYFFDDLEPFINNSSDSRVGRAAPLHEPKVQKVKLGGKGKETIENDLDEEEEEVENEENEEEKVSEEDYEDDDDDEESDCQPTTGCSTPHPCSTTSTCPTTPTACSTTTPCSTTKSTAQCKAPTPGKCTTKCPKFCAKANRKQLGNPITTVDSFLWDSAKKKISNKKRKYHSKISDGM